MKVIEEIKKEFDRTKNFIQFKEYNDKIIFIEIFPIKDDTIKPATEKQLYYLNNLNNLGWYNSVKLDTISCYTASVIISCATKYKNMRFTVKNSK